MKDNFIYCFSFYWLIKRPPSASGWHIWSAMPKDSAKAKTRKHHTIKEMILLIKVETPLIPTSAILLGSAVRVGYVTTPPSYHDQGVKARRAFTPCDD